MSLNDSLDSDADGESLYLMDVVGVEDTMAVWGKAVAKKLGISRSYVSRIEKRALQKLEEALGERE